MSHASTKYEVYQNPPPGFKYESTYVCRGPLRRATLSIRVFVAMAPSIVTSLTLKFGLHHLGIVNDSLLPSYL